MYMVWIEISLWKLEGRESFGVIDFVFFWGDGGSLGVVISNQATRGVLHMPVKTPYPVALNSSSFPPSSTSRIIVFPFFLFFPLYAVLLISIGEFFVMLHAGVVERVKISQERNPSLLLLSYAKLRMCLSSGCSLRVCCKLVSEREFGEEMSLLICASNHLAVTQATPASLPPASDSHVDETTTRLRSARHITTLNPPEIDRNTSSSNYTIHIFHCLTLLSFIDRHAAFET